MSQAVEVKKTICMWCHSHCKVAVHIRDGRLEKIEEDKEHPLSEHLRPIVRACHRARAAQEWFYHPERLKYPLKRVGEKGEGKWEVISWEQALDEIAQKLEELRRKYGAETLAFTQGTYRTHTEYATRFLNLFGSPNISGAGFCWSPTNMLGCAIIGWTGNVARLRPGVTKCCLLIGTHPSESFPRGWPSILIAQRAGMKLIVVDPRRTEEAERADIWLQLRPGTDTALLMGMINVIINEQLYDKEFVDKWCYGFDKLAERAQDYPPERVSEITWVPAEKIRQAAQMYATNKPAASISGMGIEHLANNGQAIQARLVLPAITGNIDIIGGEFIYGPYTKIVSESEIEANDKLPVEQKGKMLMGEQGRLFSWLGYELVQENVKRMWGTQLIRLAHCWAHYPIVYRAIVTGQPYPVRAMITLANNPMVDHPNVKLVYKALKSLDLYVVMEFWMTPSAELADYVLPAASWLERPNIHTFMGTSNVIEAGEAAFPSTVDGEYDRRRDYDFLRGLGMRLGQEEYWPWKSLEEAYDYRLAKTGYTLETFLKEKGGSDRVPAEERKFEKIGFATPTGKVELYSTILEKLGYDPLPYYEEPPESPISNPELAKEYPLILITGARHQPFYHSEHRQIDSLRKRHPEPIMQIHPQKASELGIEDGDWVWIETARGRVRQKCQYFKGIDPGVVHAQHGWWFPELPGEEPWLHGVWESNINVVTDDEPEHCNNITGGWPLRAELCKVYRVKSYAVRNY